MRAGGHILRVTAARAANPLANRPFRSSGTFLAQEGRMGRILLGVVLGVILVIWLLVSCVGAIL